MSDVSWVQGDSGGGGDAAARAVLAEMYSGRYSIIGPPGCGKTTFLATQIRRIVERVNASPYLRVAIRNPVMVCSLTRAAAAEVAGRGLEIDRRMVGTLHAHAYRALGRVKLVGGADIAAWNSEYSWPMSPEAFKDDADDAAFDGDVVGNAASIGDALLAELELERHRMSDPSEYPAELAAFAQAWAEFKRERGIMDFTDLIEAALATVACAPGEPGILMVDEAQDLSKLEFALVRRWGDAAVATFVVGDPWQSLYTWRGADPAIFYDAGVPDERRRVLSQSYRVPASVVRVAGAWVKEHLSDYREISYRPRPEEGVAETCGATLYEVEPICEAIERAEVEGDPRTFMVQASCGYMLVSLAAQLRRRGIPFANPWRRHRRDWNPLGGGGGVGMVARLLSLVRPCPDAPDSIRGPWRRRDVARFAAHVRAAGFLRRGAKAVLAAFEKAPGAAGGRGASESGGEAISMPGEASTAPAGDDPFGLEAEEPAPATEAVADDGGGPVVMLEELEDWFEPPVARFLGLVLAGEVRARDAAAFWHDNLLATQKKTSEYAMTVLGARGPAALVSAPRVFVGTIHSFKGAEADDVYVFPDLSSAGFRQWCQGEGPARDQVVRMFYVAMTRARSRLYACAPGTKLCAPLRRFVSEAGSNGGAA